MIVAQEQVDLATELSPMRVHLHRPQQDGNYPGILLYSEIYQQTAPIARAAMRLAGHGYLVAVPEIFHQHEPLGAVLNYDPEGTDRGNRYKYATQLSTYDRDARAVLDHLRDHPRSNGRLGAIGWCLGGHLAFRAAFQPDVRATACFYATDLHGDSLGEGKQSDSLTRLREITGTVMMMFGRKDPHVPDEGRTAIRAALTAAAIDFTFHEVDAAHAFMRDEGPRYDPSLSSIGWALALDLFERVLKR